ncbi:MAG: hypothetical protein MJ070_05385 [Lachnospiraceae bacterium]|nr:hypothetical protein [Lachnospiraceae bacterium]
MNEFDLFSAVGAVDDDLIERSEKKEPSVRSRIRKLFIAAAAIAVAVGVIFGARCLILRFGALPGVTIADSNKENKVKNPFPGQEPEMLPLPWAGDYSIRLFSGTGSFAPGKPVILKAELSVEGDWLTDGTVLLTVNGAEKDFSLSCTGAGADGNVLRPVMNDGSASMELTFTPLWNDHASGKISFGLSFVPSDPDAFFARLSASYSDAYPEIWKESGTVSLRTDETYYAADGVETRIRASSSAMGLMNDMLIAHYRSFAITGKEFSRIWYEEELRDCVCVSVVSYSEANGTVRYQYLSPTVRYESDFVPVWEMVGLSHAILDAESAEEEEVLTRRLMDMVLSDMRARGVISDAEYETERSLAEVRKVGFWEPGFPMGLDGLAHVVQKYRYTH